MKQLEEMMEWANRNARAARRHAEALIEVKAFVNRMAGMGLHVSKLHYASRDDGALAVELEDDAPFEAGTDAPIEVKGAEDYRGDVTCSGDVGIVVSPGMVQQFADDEEGGPAPEGEAGPGASADAAQDVEADAAQDDTPPDVTAPLRDADGFVIGPIAGDEADRVMAWLAQGVGRAEIAERTGRKPQQISQFRHYHRDRIDALSVAPADGLNGTERRINQRIEALGYPEPWTPDLDLKMVEQMVRGTGLGGTAALLKLDREVVLARWKQLLPEVTIETQKQLAAVLRWRVAQPPK